MMYKNPRGANFTTESMQFKFANIICKEKAEKYKNVWEAFGKP